MDNRQKIFDIRGRLIAGIITYDEAKKEAAPIIENMNSIGQEIAKKHGKKFHGFNFCSLIR